MVACPAGINVQGYVQLIAQGQYREAIELIMQRLPLPGVLGRVCPHPCESQCRRAQVDEAVAIRDLKRFAADQVDLDDIPIPKIEERSEKVAVVGSGPAGLTVAYYLRLQGYQITIFEALQELGGMLRVGIPDYRLPPDVLDKEINHILHSGVTVRTGVRLGSDVALKDLMKEGFSAVYLAIGAHLPMKIGIPGEADCKYVIDALGFLREVNLARKTAPGKQVTVIGGGNVAIDAARAAQRLGIEAVTVVYRRSEKEMPAYTEEIQGAIAEGIEIIYLAAPVKVAVKEGKVTGLKCIRTRLGDPDDSGRPRPVPMDGSEFVIPCDAVISAIGQRIDSSWSEHIPDLKWSKRGTLEVNPHTMQTTIPQIFAGGDVVRGPASVIEAVAAGHKAVAAIHRYINNEDLDVDAEQIESETSAGHDWQVISPGIPTEALIKMRHLAAPIRAASFDEVALDVPQAEAQREAGRCMNCGICSECMECVRVCEANAIDHAMQPREIEVKVGSIILATGYDILDPTRIKQYGYGIYPNVFTSLEFERLSNATGPTGGKILIRNEKGEFTRVPQSVAILHCVGSRDVNYHE